MKLKLAIIALTIPAVVNAGLFDSFKDPSTLILNQKDCRFGNYPAEIVDGKLILGGIRVAALLKTLDKNRITYENQGMEPKRAIVLIVEVKDGWVQAGYSEEKMFIGCKIN